LSYIEYPDLRYPLFPHAQLNIKGLKSSLYSSGSKKFVQGIQHSPGSSKTKPLNDEKDVQKLSRFYNGEKPSHFFSV
jgi:hypothetical protein